MNDFIGGLVLGFFVGAVLMALLMFHKANDHFSKKSIASTLTAALNIKNVLRSSLNE